MMTAIHMTWPIQGELEGHQKGGQSEGHRSLSACVPIDADIVPSSKTDSKRPFALVGANRAYGDRPE
jgi:hypothetical protein